MTSDKNPVPVCPTLTADAPRTDEVVRPPGAVALALHSGFVVGGTTTWAVRLAQGLADRGCAVTLLAHGARPGDAPLPVPSDARLDVEHLPPLAPSPAELARQVPLVRASLERLADRAGRPVVLVPGVLAPSVAIAIAVAVAEPSLVRLAGFCHADDAYDLAVLAHAEPALARIGTCSRHLQASLTRRLPHRAADIVHVPHGIDAPSTLPRVARRAGPLRLIYTGRLEHRQKRVGALAELSRELHRRGIEHRLTLVGDGPAAPDLQRRLDPARARIVPPVTPACVPSLLDAADIFVLASAYEGLSVAMIEAMARACVPIVTRVRSGADEAIEPGVSGELADVPAGADEAAVAAALADAVERALGAGLDRLAHGAWSAARTRFSPSRHLDAASSVLAAAADDGARAWPLDRPLLAAPGTSAGIAGADACGRLAAVLERCAGRRVVIHGTGAHTVALASVLARYGDRIAGFTDDDPQRHATRFCNWAVASPARARADLGATDVIISSALYEDAIYERRAVYEAQGLAVHRLYATERCA